MHRLYSLRDFYTRIVLAAAITLFAVASAYPASAHAAPRLFATTGDGSSGVSTLYELDPATGAIIQTIGPVGYLVNGLEYDHTTGKLYGSTGVIDPRYNGLIEINMTTGAGTPVGVHGWGLGVTAAITNITIDSTGQMYGWWDPGQDDLVRIDKNTGIATRVGESGVGTGRNSVDFDHLNNLYLLQGGLWYTVNPLTGAAALHGNANNGRLLHHGDFYPGTDHLYGIDGVATQPRTVQVLDASDRSILFQYALALPIHTLTFIPEVNQPPTVTHNSYYEGEEGIPVALNMSDASDPENDALQFNWTVDSPLCTIENATQLTTATVTCIDNGSFNVTLTASDGTNPAVSSSVPLTIFNIAPSLGFGFNTSILEGDTYTHTRSFIDPGADTWTVYVNYDDGAGDQVVPHDANKSFTLSHTYLESAANYYDIRMMVVDDDGGVGRRISIRLFVANVDPVVDAGPDATMQAGKSLDQDGSFIDPGADTWSATVDYGDGSGIAPLPLKPDKTFALLHAYTVPGVYTATVTVTDSDGGVGVDTVRIEVVNVAPEVDAGGAYAGTEGSAIALSGASASDGDGDPLTYAWTIDTALCSFSDAAALHPSVTCTDNGAFTATLTVNDGVNAAVVDTAAVTVSNANPDITGLTVPLAPHAVGTAVSGISATFSDAGSSDTHTCTFDFGDSSGTHISNASGGTCTAPAHTYAAPGLYTVSLVVTDDDGGTDAASSETSLVVYDPSAGFVTGGGWINSPVGALKRDEMLTGKATFGFVSKYQKGANIPTGNTEFQFKAGTLAFHSSSYEWLVVNQANKNAQFKGEGTINGAGTYKFMLWAGDAPDTFRIQITEVGGGIVYDNGFDQPLGGGSIVIHAK